MSLRANELASRRPPQPPIRVSSQPAQSAASNEVYEPIRMDMLIEIPKEDIQNFLDYLGTIPFHYNDSAPSILGRHLKTEGDVRTFFDSSVVLVVWPVALAMVPTVRNVDMVLMSEKTYNSVYLSRPDTSIITYDGTRISGTVAGIECKGPRGLDGFRNVIRAYLQGTIIQLPLSWNRVTRQLRKYAAMTGCRSILCSDGSDAYIFVFPRDESSEEVQFLHASDEASNGTRILTLREAVLFLIYLGIRLDSPFTHRYVYTRLCPACRAYCCLIYCSNLRAVLTTRHHPIRRITRSASEGDYQDMFGPAPVPEPASPSRVQPVRQNHHTHRLRLGDVVTASTSLHHIARLKKADKALEIYSRLLVEIDEVVSEDVVRVIPLNDTDTGRIMLKFFPDDSVRMLSEINAYQALQSLQGSAVPQFISVFTVDGCSGYALGLCAVDGVTLKQYFENEAPTIELFRLAWSQLCTVHDCGVAHMDVRAENILIKYDGSVVFIDFSISL